jgi:hypothetical protein
MMLYLCLKITHTLPELQALRKNGTVTEERKTRKTITSGPHPAKNYLTFAIPKALEELNKTEG